MTEAGFDRTPPKGSLQQGIEIVREYLDSAGEPVQHVEVGEEFTVRLRLRATERDILDQVAIVDLLPGGVEPVIEPKPDVNDDKAGDKEVSEDDTSQDEVANQDEVGEDEAGEHGGSPSSQARLSTVKKGKVREEVEVETGDWKPYFVDIRDDRVVLYAGLSRDANTYTYKVRATNAGSFIVPPPYAEGMYERHLQGRGVAGRLTIVEP